MLKGSYWKNIKKQFSHLQKKTFPETFHIRQNRLNRIRKSFLTSLLVNIYLDRLSNMFQVVSFTFFTWLQTEEFPAFFKRLMVIIWNYRLRHSKNRQNRHKTFDLLRLIRSNKHQFFAVDKVCVEQP